jgi:acetyl esterase/lipase
MRDRARGPLQDVQQAIDVVRASAARWNVEPTRVGVVGFSAGGHLASTAGTHFDSPVLEQWRDRNLRPDFLVLVYPVIRLGAEGHRGSRERLLGPSPPAERVRQYSSELAVTDRTPPTFLVHAADDTVVPVANSIAFFEALQEHHVPAQLFVYTAGGHGFGLENATTSDRWIDRCEAWLLSQGWLAGTSRTAAH